MAMLVLLERPDHTLDVHPATVVDRLRAHLSGARLDRDLAMGVSPDADVVHALRARLLVRPRQRRSMARCLSRAVDEAEGTACHSPAAVPTARGRVLAAAGELRCLAELLLTPAPLPARGLAMVSVLVSDGAGPLYYERSPDDLRQRALRAVAAIDPLATW